MSQSRTKSDDRGVVLILVALTMLAILVIAAMAVDLGAKRASRRSDQSVADLSSLAAGSFLAGNGGAVVASNAFLACTAAVESAKANMPAFTPTQDPATTCAVFPTDAKTGCTSTTAPLDAVFSDATRTLTIRYPIPASELTDSRFTGGVGINDGTSRCERMRVTFSETDATTFARVLGVNQQTTSGSSVIRASTSQLGQGVAALLLLERLGCGSLQNSGQGAIIVKSVTPKNPGVIQADSAGLMPPCTTNANASGYVVYGSALPASAGGGPSIVAETSANGTTGIIGLYSLGLSPAGRGGAVYPGGLSVAPVKASISSRQPVDDKYNGSSGQITALHAAAYPKTNWSAATATTNGYAVITGNGPCKGVVDPVVFQSATKIFADCNTFEPAANIFPAATDFIARGNISIKNTSVLSLPAARNIFVRGCAPGCGGAVGSAAIDIQGKLLVNTGESALALPDAFVNGVPCSARKGRGAGGTTANWTQIATFSGSVNITGQSRLCQTFVYMGQNAATYTRKAVVANGVSPEVYPSVAQCSATLPCPKDNVETDWPFSITGGGSTSDWSAPNQLLVQPTASDFAANPFEDLALWSETSSPNVVLKGQAGNQSEGVYFLPNASASFQGQGTQPILLNAQFFIRNLNMSGQGTMTLSPNPADAVITPIPGAMAIIR